MGLFDRSLAKQFKLAGDLYTLSGSLATVYGIMDQEDVMETDNDGNLVPMRRTIMRVTTTDATTLSRSSVLVRGALSYAVRNKELETDGVITKLVVVQR